MLRPRGANANGSGRLASSDITSIRIKTGGKRSGMSVGSIFVILVAFMLGISVLSFFHVMSHLSADKNVTPKTSIATTADLVAPPAQVVPNVDRSPKPPAVFDDMIRRSRTKKSHCDDLGLTQKEDFQGLNDHNAHLPQFGLLDFIDNRYETYIQQQSEPYPYQCVLPPEEECDETQFTVIFMAYNPSRLQKMYNQIIKMTSQFNNLVKEVVVVWNGERNVEETHLGQALVDLTKQRPVRISYPLKAGFPNDLFNRYHPRLQITTKAIMYYDDDGPFYSYHAVLGGFELWKRNANAQIGAMARKLDLNPRQEAERVAISTGLGDRDFISQCPTDRIRYNFNEFAQFGAKMVLPSGSFLHSNYLACLWHPIFEELRKYVQEHPVNPDDGTVSAIISHLAGRAPKVYSRRINEATADEANKSRRLSEETTTILSQNHSRHWNPIDNEDIENEAIVTWDANNTEYDRRRLMDGINWDAGGDHQKKHDWGKLRSDAANSLIRYFGSVNSGSIGWCYGTQYQKGEYCHPDQARLGQLPWLNADHTSKATCP